MTFDQPLPYVFDALIVPGGVPAAEALRMQPDAARLLAVGFVQAFLAAAKPVAVIAHAPWTVIEAGTEWVEQVVVVDGNRRLLLRADSCAHQQCADDTNDSL